MLRSRQLETTLLKSNFSICDGAADPYLQHEIITQIFVRSQSKLNLLSGFSNRLDKLGLFRLILKRLEINNISL